MRVRPYLIGFAVLSACSPGPKGPRPGAGNPTRPAVTASASPQPAAPEERTFVEIKAAHARMCGRTERGFLYCWGHVMIPGETEARTANRPTRIEGMSGIAGFTILSGGMLVGWSAAGTVFRVTQDNATTPFRVVSGFQEAQPTPQDIARYSWGPARAATSHIVAGSQDCLLSNTGEVFCSTSGGSNSLTGTPLLRVPAPPIRTLASSECGVAVDGSVVCWNLDRNQRELFGKKVDANGVIRAPVEGPVEQALLMRARPRGEQVCVVRAGGAASCDDPIVDRRLRALAEGKRVTRLFQAAQYILCVTREDGASRCTAQFDKPWPELEVLHEVIPKVDSSLGVAIYPYNICALGRDQVARCWGTRADGRVGDGVALQLSRAERVPDITGASEISAEGGVICARFGADRVSCWGAVAAQVPVPRRDIKLPEPIDRIEGGVPLCVHGAKSGDWYCRNKYFFFGNLPDDFARLVDTRGAPVRDVAIQVDNGLGIAVAKPAGGAGRFYYSGSAKPLKIEWLDPTHPMATAVYFDARGGAVLADGTAAFRMSSIGTETQRVPGKHRAVLRTVRCAVDAQDRLVCMDSPGAPRVIVGDVAEVDADCVRTKRGEVHCVAGRPKKKSDAATFRRIDGLPPTIVEIARDCGRTGEGEIYCWGSVFDLGVFQPVQMTPVEVAMP